MAVTISSATRLSGNVWRVVYSSDLGGSPDTFYIYMNGVHTSTTTAGEWTGEVTESDILTINDSATELPESYPPRIRLNWKTITATKYYKVEEYIAAAWVEVARIQTDGSVIYTWTSRLLEDVTTHQFKVTAFGDNGNLGTATSVSALMVRYPDTPNVSMAYASGTAKVTISAV